MVVSEMGDVWSPNTEPASVAASVTVMSVGSSAWATGTTMGMRIPKVPQAVPVEKLRKAAMTKTMAGRNPAEMPPAVTACCTKAWTEGRGRRR